MTHKTPGPLERRAARFIMSLVFSIRALTVRIRLDNQRRAQERAIREYLKGEALEAQE